MSHADLIARLRGTLPVCPFDRRSPDYWTAGEDGKPCHVCGTTEDGPDLCRGADTRCMTEAADVLDAKDKQIAELEADNRRMKRREETSLKFWMRAAKAALAGDTRELRNRVDLIEAEPLTVVLSSPEGEANG